MLQFKAVRYVVIGVSMLVLTPYAVEAQTATTPSTLSVYSTIYSIGIEWFIVGDSNHNATVSVRYRIAGSANWNQAMALVRVDSANANMLAGSILFLQPARAYELELTLVDPDGGGGTATTGVSTLPLPSMPGGGRVLHVAPGSGAGDGSAERPFRGIAAAETNAQPGDIMLLHAGNYGGRIRFAKSGAADNYIVWLGAGDGEVALQGIDVAASHIWLEGLSVRDQYYGVLTDNGPEDVVVRRNELLGNHYGIFLSRGGTAWYIADNVIVGDTPYWTQSFDGEGIDLHISSGHTVAHNSITNVADGISEPNANVDIFGNDIFDTSDDGIEGDNGWANVRMWGNRIHNAAHNGISFQPQVGAPWYIIRNQIVGFIEAAFKFRTTDRFVLLNNTIVNWSSAWPGGAMICCNTDHLLRAIARNNLWIAVRGGPILGFGAGIVDWRTDLDYDGFAWGDNQQPFVYGGVAYPDLSSLASSTGLERHGVSLTTSCFESLNVPNQPPAPVPAQYFSLRSDCPAVDAGAVLPNLGGASAGARPDLGAYEYGLPLPVYGPRPADGTPFGGVPAPVPGTIEAERFDNGAANSAYRDVTPGNSGSVFRSTDVDLEPTSDAGGGYDVGWVDAGEWLNYTVGVSTSGAYKLEVRVAANAQGGTFHVEVDHVDRTGPMIVPNTGGWQNWTTVTVDGLTLTAGTHALRLVMDSRSAANIVGNFNWIRLSIDQSNGTPYGGTPAALPGTIEAERFDEGGANVAYRDLTSGNSGGVFRATDVDLEPTADAGGGFDIGWVDAGEWLNYSVNVATTANYLLEVRVASIAGGGTFHVDVDGLDRSGSLVVPNTGGWQNWTTIGVPGVSLAAGTHVVRLAIDSRGPQNVVGNFNWLRFTTSTSNDGTPYGGAAAPVPGTIEVERFNDGGANIAYRDTTAGNTGGEFRSTDFDIQSTSDSGGGYNVGWVDAGEWLNYTVNVTTPGTYALDVRVASSGAGGAFHVEVNHIDRTGPLAVPNTGGWQNWTTVTVGGVPLSAGMQVIRLVIDGRGPSGVVGNFNWLRLTTANDGTPYGGTAVALPGTIELERFNDGGANVAYVDTTAGNSGSALRSTDVDLQATSDNGGGYNVGWVDAGEWLNYTVNVTAPGTYALDVRVASNGVGGTFHVEVNRVDRTGPLAVPNTGGWQNWTTVTANGIALAAGPQVIRLVIDSRGPANVVGNFNWLRMR